MNILHTKNIKLNKQKHIYLLNNQDYYSVTTILSGNYKPILPTDSMKVGITLHKVFERYFKNNKKILIHKNKHTSSDVLHKLNLYLDFFKKEKNVFENYLYLEKMFVFEDTTHNIKFAGTVDFISEDIIVDFKTGTFNQKHAIQIAVYCYVFNKDTGIVPYIIDNEIKTFSINKEQINLLYLEFVKKVKDFNLALASNHELHIEDIDSLLHIYIENEKNIKELTDYKDNLKNQILEVMTFYDINKYRYKNSLVYEKKESERLTLKPENKRSLLLNYPEYFYKQISKKTYAIKIED